MNVLCLPLNNLQMLVLCIGTCENDTTPIVNINPGSSIPLDEVVADIIHCFVTVRTLSVWMWMALAVELRVVLLMILRVVTRVLSSFMY